MHARRTARERGLVKPQVYEVLPVTYEVPVSNCSNFSSCHCFFNFLAIEAAIAFLLKGKKPENLPNFKNEEEAIKYFADVNAGSKSETGRKLAKKVAPRFKLDI